MGPISDSRRRQNTDVDMAPPSLPVRQPRLDAPGAAASPRTRRDSELFAKRLPTSPMPADTPKKPRPPARPLGQNNLKSKSRPRRRDVSDGDDDDDPLSLSFTSPDIITVRRATGRPRSPVAHSKKKKPSPPREVSRERSVSASASRSGSRNPQERRLTLDQEMRDARARSLLREEVDNVDFDSGTLVGVGTRKKTRGFLAHGGAGGVPVFMCEGYVDGVERSDSDHDHSANDDVDEDDGDGDYSPRRRGTSAKNMPTVAKKKGRR